MFGLPSTQGARRDGLPIVEVSSVAEAADRGAVAGFICTPPFRHVEDSLAALDDGLHLFVEKPLASRVDRLDELEKAAQDRGARVLVGTVLRHHPLVEALEGVIAGWRLLHIRAECATWLPGWRPGRDYRTIYSAKRSLGGGIVLDLIHEVDLVDFFGGGLLEGVVHAQHKSALEIDAEDHAEMDLVASRCSAEVFLAWYSRIERRSLQIFADEGSASLDFRNGSLVVVDGDGSSHETSFTGDIDDVYVRQLVHFEAVLAGEPPKSSIGDAARQLRVLDRAGALR